MGIVVAHHHHQQPHRKPQTTTIAQQVRIYASFNLSSVCKIVHIGIFIISDSLYDKTLCTTTDISEIWSEETNWTGTDFTFNFCHSGTGVRKALPRSATYE